MADFIQQLSLYNLINLSLVIPSFTSPNKAIVIIIVVLLLLLLCILSAIIATDCLCVVNFASLYTLFTIIMPIALTIVIVFAFVYTIARLCSRARAKVLERASGRNALFPNDVCYLHMKVTIENVCHVPRLKWNDCDSNDSDNGGNGIFNFNF